MVNGGLADIRHHFAEFPNRLPSIFQHCFFRNRFERSSSWRLYVRLWTLYTICVRVSHTFLCRHSWEWMSPGAVVFTHKNRITERNSHLADEANRSSIPSGCQAKTEHHRELARVVICGGGNQDMRHSSGD